MESFSDLDPTLTPVKPIPIELEELPEQNATKRIRKSLNGLYKVQKYSAYTFGVFLGIHVTSVIIIPSISELLIPSSVKQEIFEISRAVYHAIPFFEKIVILGASFTHIFSGIAIRYLRGRLNKYRTKNFQNNSVINEKSDYIGLGGITALLGLGYRKSLILKIFPTLSPLSFSGYVLIPLICYHFLKFRYFPILVDGDSSLINLDYISYYLNHSKTNYAKLFNLLALFSLVWTMSYHSVSGWLKFNGKYSWDWKRAGYMVITSISALSVVSVLQFKNNYINLDKAGFIGRSFLKYLSSYLLNDYI